MNIKDNLHKKIRSINNNIIKLIEIMLLVVLFAILLITTIFTTYLTYDMSDIYIQYSNVPMIVFSLAITIIIIMIIERLFRKLSDNEIAKIASIYALIVSLIWIFIANAEPAWDSKELIRASNALLGSQNPSDIQEWNIGSYMDHFPFQVPLVYLFSFLSLISGDKLYVLIELLNALANSITAYYLVKITSIIFKNSLVTKICLIIIVGFGGLYLYSTFVYGNLISIPFTLAAFYITIKAIESNDRIVKHIIISSVLLCVSYLLKSTMQISIIAYTICILIFSLKYNKMKLIIYGMLPYILCFITTNLSILSVNNIIDRNIGGEHEPPKMSWIVMGIGGGQELNPNSNNVYDARKPGWFDAYVWINPKEEGYKSYTEMNKEMIKKRIERFINNPSFALYFFGRKIIAEWTEPTFEGYLASNWKSNDPLVPDHTRADRIYYTKFAPSFYYGKANKLSIIIMDVNQTIILLGAFISYIYIYIGKININIINLALGINTLGGFILYIFWEMKSQYILPFYLYLIPYSSYGIYILYRFIKQKVRNYYA